MQGGHVASVTVDTSDLAALTRDVSDGLMRAAPELAATLSRVVQESFDAEGRRGDQPAWDRTTLVAFANRKTQRGKLAAEISSAYHNGDWKTGTDTGTLRASWRAEVTRAGGRVVVEAVPGVDYGATFHGGGPAVIDGRSVTLPPRMVTVTETDADAAVDIILGAILE
jgi:hypothetical protein